jgi:hypothetical protein
LTTNPVAEAIVEDLKSVEKFDLRSVLTKASYPTEDVSVYLDGNKAHELNIVLDLIDAKEAQAEELSAGKNGSIADSPEKEAVLEDIEALKRRETVLLKEIADSRLTFTLRGVAPTQWRLVDKEARRKIKAASKSEDDQYEAQLERNEYVNVELLALATVQITAADGQVDKSKLSHEDAQKLFDVLLESEYMKLKQTVENLTFAHTLFNNVTLQDADFLSKSSADRISQATSE